MDYVTPGADSRMNSDESIQTGFDRSEINQPATFRFQTNGNASETPVERNFQLDY